MAPDVARLMAGPLYGKDPWPLRFYSHNFFATCFNTLACSIVYNNCQFGTRRLDPYGEIVDHPSEPPVAPDWRDGWAGWHAISPIDGKTFPGPIEFVWTALNGDALSASVDLDALFRDRLVLHNVSFEDIRKRWLETKSVDPVVPDILVDLDDRTISIHMSALVATEAEQVPGNTFSHFRNDLIPASMKTY